MKTDASRNKTIKRKFRFRRPVVLQQSMMDCGAACLATVLSYYGKRVTINRIRELANVGASGSSLKSLLTTAQHFGFGTSAMLSTYEHLQNSNFPAIANWNGIHWIVIYKVTAKTVVIADPADGIQNLDKNAFLKNWTRYTLFLEPTEKLAEIQESKPSLKQLLPYLKPHKKIILEIVLASLFIQVISVFIPLFNKFIVDDIIVKFNWTWLKFSVLGVMLLIVINSFLAYLRQNLLLRISAKISYHILYDFYHKIFTLPLTFFEKRKAGDITSRFEENENIDRFITETWVYIFLEVFTTILYLGLMFYLHKTLAIIASSTILFNAFMIYYLTPILRSSYRDVFQKNVDFASHLIESLHGWNTLRISGSEHIRRWKWHDLFDKYLNAYMKAAKYDALSNQISQFVNGLGNAVVMLVGAFMAMNNQLSIGSLAAFLLLTKGVVEPIQKIVGAWDSFQEAINSVERINDVMEAEKENTHSNKIKIKRFNGDIEYSNVSFRYAHDANDNILQNISLQIEPGKRTAIIGRSGSGKSTLLKLLLQFYQPTSGQVYIDGFDISQLSPSLVRQQISVVDQENYLFSGTVKENISLARPGTLLKDVISIAKLAHIHDFIASLDQGYNYELHSQGKNLSGGQRQRICIARALLQDNAILALDEAFSALDIETSQSILQNMNEYCHGKTILMITHRLPLVRHFDKIVVMDKGHIIEQGTHQELFDKEGLYYYLSTQKLDI